MHKCPECGAIHIHLTDTTLNKLMGFQPRLVDIVGRLQDAVRLLESAARDLKEVVDFEMKRQEEKPPPLEPSTIPGQPPAEEKKEQAKE